MISFLFLLFAILGIVIVLELLVEKVIVFAEDALSSLTSFFVVPTFTLLAALTGIDPISIVNTTTKASNLKNFIFLIILITPI